MSKSNSSHGQTQFYQDTLNALSKQINTYLGSAAAADEFNGVALVAKNGTPVFHKQGFYGNISANKK